MSFDDLTPRAKVVQPVQVETKLEIRFNQVLIERCASDAPYRYVFEVVRAQLSSVGLHELSHSFENGEIVARFTWWWPRPLTLRMAFYSAGVSTVFDADAKAGRGWFKRARERKALELVKRLTAQVFAGDDFKSVALSHSEPTRPPQHTL